MKRIFLAVVALGLLTSSLASAGPMVAQHWVWEQLKFRSHNTSVTLYTPNSGIDGMYVSSNGAPRFVDSLTVMNSAASALDTTSSISTVGWAPAYAGLSTDTTLVAVLGISDAGSTTATSATDSLYIYPQGSYDGKNWFNLAVVPTVAPLKAIPGALPGAASPNGFGVITQEGSGATTKLWSLKFYNVGLGGTRVLLNLFDLARIPMIRFIIQTDASSAATYNLQATLGHWGAGEDLNAGKY